MSFLFTYFYSSFCFSLLNWMPVSFGCQSFFKKKRHLQLYTLFENRFSYLRNFGLGELVLFSLFSKRFVIKIFTPFLRFRDPWQARLCIFFCILLETLLLGVNMALKSPEAPLKVYLYPRTWALSDGLMGITNDVLRQRQSIHFLYLVNQTYWSYSIHHLQI